MVPVRARVILASGSTIRRKILRKAGIRFTVIPSNIDEDRIKEEFVKSRKSVLQLAQRLARDKAVAITTGEKDLVIGADQILEFKGKVFDKPKTREQLKNRLLMLRAQQHRLVGAICIIQNGLVVWEHVDISKLTMRDFSEDFLETYIREHGENVLSCVGGYKFEGFGAQLFEKTEGDFFSILGLPLLPLLEQLRMRGAISN